MVRSFLRHLTSLDHEFPLEISFPGASVAALNSITKVKISIFQKHVFFVPVEGIKRRVIDSTPVTKLVTISPSVEPCLLSLPFSPMILGRFTTARFRISHSLRLVFHRHWRHWRSTWEEDVEIFQPNTEPVDTGLSAPGSSEQLSENKSGEVTTIPINEVSAE
jgi:hypothetical protein